MTTGDWTRNNGFKLKQEKFRLEVRKNFLIMRVAVYWNKLAR